MSVRQLTLYTLLGALIYACKMIMAPLPNIEPVSLLVMLLAVVFGWKGLISVAVYIGLEYLTWGLQVWSLCYLYVWPLLFALAYGLRAMESRLGWALLSGFFGLFFGALCALVYIVIGGWSYAFSWWLAGIPWDLVHCAGNFFMALLLFSPIRKILGELKKKYG